MQSRMQNPAVLVPAAMKALHDLSKAHHSSSLPRRTQELVQLRVSQINGCSVCADSHAAGLKEAGETDKRLFTLACWRDTPYFTEAERAALALAEAVTRIADRPDPVPDAIWDEATRHYDEAAMADLLLDIASINVWNRLNVATRQVAGVWR